MVNTGVGRPSRTRRAFNGDAMLRARELQGLSMQMVRERFEHLSGRSPSLSTFYGWQSGMCRPSDADVSMIAKALGVRVQDLRP